MFSGSLCSCSCSATLFASLGWVVMKCLQPQKENALQINDLKTKVKANMLFYLFVIKYDHKKRKPTGFILVLEHRLNIWLMMCSDNFCRTVLGLLE